MKPPPDHLGGKGRWAGAPLSCGPCGVPGDTSSSPPQRHCFRGGNLPVEASQVRRRVTCGGRCLPLFVLSGEHAPAFPFSPEVPTPSLDPDLEQDPRWGCVHRTLGEPWAPGPQQNHAWPQGELSSWGTSRRSGNDSSLFQFSLFGPRNVY